eukprot:Skav219062  [mRNA]  locus=scaffold1033:61001:75505:+ [translate_table: standard]
MRAPLCHNLRQEFGTLLSSLGQNPTEQELQEWIGGDGEHDASRIDFHTFLSLMSRKLKETDPGQHFRLLWGQTCCRLLWVFDRDRDGFISGGELRASMTNLGERLNDTEASVDLKNQSWQKTFHASLMGGAYVGMACLLSFGLGGNMFSSYITQMAVFAALFPVNLLLILQSGGQLFSGNAATMAMGVLEKKVTMKALLRDELKPGQLHT